MGMIQEFKEFAVKGNAMDLAVGVIIGGAFGKIVDSIVGDLIMPLISRVVGKIDFSNMFVILGENPSNLAGLADLKKAGIPVFAYGSFLTILVNFVILAFAPRNSRFVEEISFFKSEKPPQGGFFVSTTIGHSPKTVFQSAFTEVACFSISSRGISPLGLVDRRFACCRRRYSR